ncbi:hypothetical protein VPH35_120939 [Triticum aestivum]
MVFICGPRRRRHLCSAAAQRSAGHLSRPPAARLKTTVSARRFRAFLQPINRAGAPSSAASHLSHTPLLILPPTSLLLFLLLPLATSSLSSLASYKFTSFVTKLSPAKMSTVTRAYLDQRLAAANRCSKEAAMAGAKAAAVASVAAAVPTLASVRMLPWARAHLNPTGQALIISTVAGMAYFIVADKTILSMARKHSFEDAPDHLKNTSFN